ncbi:GNAT family N-acetyltransferase [Taibaiella soli]|uniref:N-acetyltransferase n=1 Tax=Taibaiella soli TaxID=1649169 RepID=A0A2W2B755_9BACT|nr:GNAT family N-acetyltransferase [Taibaiella soli]PZF72079.1 N-acetyltransferase [Taibaiella soli]
MEIINSIIPVETYRRLRRECGLSDKTEQAATIGLKKTVHSVMVKEAAEVIGMGRLIGDGGCFCQIVDICVLPQYQGKGIGKIIMKDLTDFIQTQLPESCYISLLADGDASFLYEQFGFKDAMPQSKGMFLKR